METQRTTFYVHKRPHVHDFLETVSCSCSFFSFHDSCIPTGPITPPRSQVAQWYDVVVFTAAVREYGDPLIDVLDGGKGIIKKRYFREVIARMPCNRMDVELM